MLAIECQSGLVYKLAGGCIVEYSTFETYECSVGLGTVVWESGAQSSVRAGRLENACLFPSRFFPGPGTGGTIRDMG